MMQDMRDPQRGRWDPAQTPWCAAHWAAIGGNVTATQALIGEFGLKLSKQGFVLDKPEVFQALILQHSPLCCALDAAALERVRQYGNHVHAAN